MSGRLWAIVEEHRDAQVPYRPSLRKVATEIGVTPTTLTNWRQLRDMPEEKNLRALARLTGVPYDEVLRAALLDTGYMTDPLVSRR